MAEYGYTTGSTATAAAKAAVKTLFTQEKQSKVYIDTPKGIALTMDVHYTSVKNDKVETYVYKNYSDDPDVTKGIDIHVRATKIEKPGIVIETGVGIGIVTKKGLRIPVGQPAINPVPMGMILKECGKVLPKNSGVNLFFTIPKGLEVSKKTFNSKLGIEGGISIIGTTGIVEPMSDDAYKESLKIELNVKYHSTKADELTLVFGNFGLDYLSSRTIPENEIQKTSNFIYYMVNAAKEIGYKKITLVGHIGKMVKVAFGMKNTHSKYGDNRMESIVLSCKNNSRDKEKILDCNTTDEAIDKLKEFGTSTQVLTDIANRCKWQLEEWCENKLDIEIEIFSTIHGTLYPVKESLT